MIDTNTSLFELALISRGVMDVLRRHHLDFCCQGARTLTEAALENGLDPQSILIEIEAAKNLGDRPEDWLLRKPVDLIVYLQNRFHEPFRENMPGLIDLAAGVERKHAEHEHCPRGLVERLKILGEGVETHLQAEEELFFPILMGHHHGELPKEDWHREHEQHETKLDGIRSLTSNYRCPDDADADWRLLYEKLDQLEADLMEHMHLENNVLFNMPGLI